MPNNWIHGLKAIPKHVLGFGIPLGLAVHFIPPPYNFAVAGGIGVWRAIAEHGDYKGKRDTGAKAVIDFAAQVAGTAVGVLIPH